MAQSFNMQYFELSDDLSDRARAKLNYNIRRICALFQQNQDNLPVSNGMAVATQQTTQKYTEAIKQSEDATNQKINQAIVDLRREIREAEARAKAYADGLIDDVLPVGILVASKSKTQCPIRLHGVWQLFNQTDIDGVYFWERTH